MPGARNGGSRGSIKARKNRKQWLLDTWGDGITVECAVKSHPNCLGILTLETLTVDRYPIPGRDGGTYSRDNIRPACAPCNNEENKRSRGKHLMDLLGIRDAQERGLVKLVDLLKDAIGIIGDTDCRLDHHGYCQEHGWFSTDLPCPVARWQMIKELIQ